VRGGSIARWNALTIACAGTLIPFACGSNGDGSGASADIVAACAHEAMTECTMYDTCQGGLATIFYGSLHACATRRAQQCERNAVSPGASYGAAGIATCDASQQAQTCDEWIGILTPGCEFTGTRLNNQPCRDGSQCLSGFCDQYRLRTERNVCGVCNDRPLIGVSCNLTCGGDGSVQCVYASPTDSGGVCVTLGVENASCSKTAPCSSGFGCAMPSGATAGQCVRANGNVGDPCADDVGPFCDYRRRIFCNTRVGTCAVGPDVPPTARSGSVTRDSARAPRRESPVPVWPIWPTARRARSAPV
jgi:hypothetical protein